MGAVEIGRLRRRIGMRVVVTDHLKASRLRPALQCQHKVPSGLGCFGCETFVNYTGTLAPHQKDWSSYKCNSILWACPAIACWDAKSATCDPLAGGTGRCKDVNAP